MIIDISESRLVLKNVCEYFSIAIIIILFLMKYDTYMIITALFFILQNRQNIAVNMAFPVEHFRG